MFDQLSIVILTVLYILVGVVVAYVARRVLDSKEPQIMKNTISVLLWPITGFFLGLAMIDIGLEMLFERLDRIEMKLVVAFLTFILQGSILIFAFYMGIIVGTSILRFIVQQILSFSGC